MEHLQNIQRIFSDHLLRIPDYQRGYAWGKQQLDEFLDDLDLLEAGQEHYIGTLVLNPSQHCTRITDEDGNGLDCFDVVDGQQRLTTIVLLLDCIRRALQVLAGQETLASGIRKRYLATRDIEGQQQPKFTLNADTHGYFMRNFIADQPDVEGPTIRSEERLQQAHEQFTRYLRDKGEAIGAQYPAWLIELVQRITLRLKLTVYEVPREADVGVIFEVMNNRGKPLSEMEKVKNYLLYVASKIQMKAASGLAERVNGAWSEMFARLMAANAASSYYEDQLLRSHWLMAYDYRPRDWAGSKSVKGLLGLKEHRGNEKELLEKVGDYVESLRSFCIAYCDVVFPSRPDAFSPWKGNPRLWRELVRWGTKLVRVESIASFLPLLGAVRLRHPSDGQAYLELLKLCERYAFRVFRIAERRSNAGQAALFELGHQLYQRQQTPAQALDIIATNLLWYAPDDKFRAAIREVANWYEWYGIKYFLYEYEEHLAGDREVILPWDDLVKRDKKETIEHILPQTPNDPYWVARWTEEQVARLLHDVGNLCLTQDNSSYSNRSFPQKQGRPGGAPRCYAAGLRMEQQLLRYDDWTEVQLQHRRKEIEDWAIDRWLVETPRTIGVPPDDSGDEACLPEHDSSELC